MLEGADGVFDSKHVVIVDYGLGNLFSIERALKFIGASVEISSEPDSIYNATHLVLPGVGAFGDGIRGLLQRDLTAPINNFVDEGRPFLGICLGMHLLLTFGEEFGPHRGLNLVPGRVVALLGDEQLKVPHVGWSKIKPPDECPDVAHRDVLETSTWRGTILENTKIGSYVYFLHSYIVKPDDPTDVLAISTYGDNTFCSVLRRGNIFACQFHPERSGVVGLEIYRTFLQL
jgi:imidazole glycerol-phosphate synthase subunit HisH